MDEARLAALGQLSGLSESSLGGTTLDRIIASMRRLKALDVEGVAPMFLAAGTDRDDRVHEEDPDRLLESVPHTFDRLVVVPRGA